MLRAAYFGQELLSTFSTAIGEIALIPATGGLFAVTLTYEVTSPQEGASKVQEVLLWDRKSEGGFPETKVLKQRVRDYIEPARDLGHSDRKKHVAARNDNEESKEAPPQTEGATAEAKNGDQDSAHAASSGKEAEDCEDCK